MSEKPKRAKTGGGPKRAPQGFYTASQAREILGMTPSAFSYYVRKGRIKKHVPPLRKEGFYNQKEIKRLATEMALYLHTIEGTETRTAQPLDAQGIVDVLEVRGWKTATAEQRISWYAVNPYIDYIAIRDGLVGGYIHAVPYTDETLEAFMAGKKRSWDVQPSDILPYKPEASYSLYIGIATRDDIEKHTQRVGFRLISGFFAFLEELAEQQIYIHRLYAVSNQPDGMKLCKSIGFIEQPAQEGDLFPRFMLDLEASDSHFAKLYREAISR